MTQTLTCRRNTVGFAFASLNFESNWRMVNDSVATYKSNGILKMTGLANCMFLIAVQSDAWLTTALGACKYMQQYLDHDPNRAVAYVYMIAMCKQWNSVLFTDGTQIVSHYTWMVMVWSLQQCNKQTHEKSYHTKSCRCIQCLWTEAGSSLWNNNRNLISRTK